jgi:perosamine synthetase
MGDLGAFSLYGNKIITTGEGGIITTSNALLAERLRLLRDHAMDSARRYWHTDIGFNYRMTNLQAAIGCAQLERLNELISKRQHIAEEYRKHLSTLRDITINPSRPWAEPVNWLTAVVLPTGTSSDKRDSLIRALHDQDIDSRPFFYAIPDLPPYKEYREIASTGLPTCTVARDLAARGINLPTYSGLTSSDIARVASAFASIVLGTADAAAPRHPSQ